MHPLMHALMWLAVGLIILKLAGFIFWLWWVVLIPTLIFLGLFAALYLFISQKFR